ncbi:MAG: CD225/dispanin family protein [Muribaculaceae bacterium]|nr:CD225/dispanin family protein [Muribaculaceae bacterium]
MQIYVFRNGEKSGPFTLEQLAQSSITPDTLVWYQGLAQWEPAGTSALTAHIFHNPANPPVPPVMSPNAGPQNACGPQYAPGSPMPAEPMPPRPSTYMALSIIVTILCCLPFGIIGIVMSSKVDSAYNQGDYNEALRCSCQARNWCIAGIASSCAVYVLYFVLIMLQVVTLSMF